MECRNLGCVWVCTQIVVSVVLCEFAQRFFNSCFHFNERGLISCDTQIVCVYEATCSAVERLVVSLEVEKDGGQDTSLWHAVLLFLHLLRSLFSSSYNLLLDIVLLYIVCCLELCCRVSVLGFYDSLCRK